MKMIPLISSINKLRNYRHKHLVVKKDDKIKVYDSIKMNGLCKEKLTALFADNVIKGNSKFFVPYVLNEIDKDFNIVNDNVVFSDKNKEVIEWMKKHNIEYECRIPSHSLSRNRYEYDYNLATWLYEKNIKFKLDEKCNNDIVIEQENIKYFALIMTIQFSIESYFDNEIL